MSISFGRNTGQPWERSWPCLHMTDCHDNIYYLNPGPRSRAFPEVPRSQLHLPDKFLSLRFALKPTMKRPRPAAAVENGSPSRRRCLLDRCRPRGLDPRYRYVVDGGCETVWMRRSVSGRVGTDAANSIGLTSVGHGRGTPLASPLAHHGYCCRPMY
ncbi:hypothetical protein BCR44DRAFT_1438204 [Catenaria anguillulae PL171]|uniref:Uncharacterized protein n=1 Tax=Catenaria anguillulae PL171 TaxID=765915 RepID=A0A1Y2HG92_9FUNG|nr:hypothetical protein BCR44DRAFT_1438204 [Catenaria anguillulae PL171]